MFLKDFIFHHLYYFLTGAALLSALLTYLYFYNREVLSYSDSSSKDLSLEIETENSEESSKEVSVLTDSNKRKQDYINVDLSGAVERPGIYSLNSGDRLADLISLSGGVTNEVSEKWLSRRLNLSAVLEDEQKIYIPFEWEIESREPSYELRKLVLEVPAEDKELNKGVELDVESNEVLGNSSSESGKTNVEGSNETILINLNQASKKDLIELPGVGEVTAGKIIDNRPYRDLVDLEEKTDIYASTIEKIKDLVTF